MSALRSALSAIGHAEAVSSPPAVAGAGSTHIAGEVSGLGAGEARRRALSATEFEQIIGAEISERLRAADDYERSGHADRARRLRREASVFTSAASGTLTAVRSPAVRALGEQDLPRLARLHEQTPRLSGTRAAPCQDRLGLGAQDQRAAATPLAAWSGGTRTAGT